MDKEFIPLLKNICDDNTLSIVEGEGVLDVKFKSSTKTDP